MTESDREETSSRSNEQKAKGGKKQVLTEKIEKLINIWRCLFYSTVSGSMLWLIMLNGWHPINQEDIEIKGSKNIKIKTIINESGISLPQTLLSLDPRKFEKEIMRTLPVDVAHVRRYLMPPSLEIYLQEKKPIAYATKRKGKLKEKGLLDKNADWIENKFSKNLQTPPSSIYVEGWMPSRKKRISTIFSYMDQLGAPIKTIMFSSNGELDLETQNLGIIQLGPNSGKLISQLKAIAQLSRNLPTKFLNKPGMRIDMSDPAKPELQFSSPNSSTKYESNQP